MKQEGVFTHFPKTGHLGVGLFKNASMVRLDQWFLSGGEQGRDFREDPAEGFFEPDMIILSHRIARDLETPLGRSRPEGSRVIRQKSENERPVTGVAVRDGAPPRCRSLKILETSLAAPGKPFHEKPPFRGRGRIDKNGPVEKLAGHGRRKRFHYIAGHYVRSGEVLRKGTVRNPEPPAWGGSPS